MNDELSQDAAVWLLKVMAASITAQEENFGLGWTDVCRDVLPKLYPMLHKPVEPCQTEYAIPVLKWVKNELEYAQTPDHDDTWDYIDRAVSIEYYQDLVMRLQPWSLD